MHRDVLVPKGLLTGPPAQADPHSFGVRMATAAGSHSTETNSRGNGGMQRNVMVLNESL